MEIVFKAAAAALVSCVCVLLIKGSNAGGAYALGVCCAVLICIAAVSLLSEITEFVNELILQSGLSSAVFMPVIKCMGIGITVSIVSGLCKDAGQNASANAVEYLGAAAAVFTALPLISMMLSSLEELL